MAVEPPAHFAKHWLEYIPLITDAELLHHIAHIRNSPYAQSNAKWLLEQLNTEKGRRGL